MNNDSFKNLQHLKEINLLTKNICRKMTCTLYFFIFVCSLIKYTFGIFGFFKSILGIRHRKNNILTSTFLNEKQSDKNKCTVCDQIQEEYECCKIQCCSENSLESLESINCNFCCKSEKVSDGSKNSKPYCSIKQYTPVDKFCSSNIRERRKCSKADDTIHNKLSCIIKRLDHLIQTCPSQSNTSKYCSATDQPADSITTVANPQSGIIICASKSSCNKEPLKNECEKQPQKNVIPAVNTSCAMPVFNNTFSLPETRSLNDCLTVVQHGVTIGYIMYTKIDPCGVSCSKSSCNVEPVKNDCEEPSQGPVIPVDTCCSEVPVKCLSETKIQHNLTQSITRCPVDIPSKQNLITPTADCSNEKSCSELQSIDLCTEVMEDTNQKDEYCTVDNNNLNVIRDDETNKNISTKRPTEPKPPPVPVKTIKNITKPKTSNKQKPVNCYDEIKAKPISKHNKLNSNKSINKR